jgi:hypothetical protein
MTQVIAVRRVLGSELATARVGIGIDRSAGRVSAIRGPNPGAHGPVKTDYALTTFPF